MSKNTDAASDLRHWSDSSRIWLAGTALGGLLAAAGGVIILGFAALLAQVLLWPTIGIGLGRLRAARHCPNERAEAKPLLLLLFLGQLVSLLYLAWLWLNLINIDLNTH
ncbi:hypothetical protein GCM10027594_04850 [Hymenobacter agri]